jgi:hypothetical protein
VSGSSAPELLVPGMVLPGPLLPVRLVSGWLMMQFYSWTPRVKAPSTTRLVPEMKLAAGLGDEGDGIGHLLRRPHPAGGVQCQRGAVQLRVALLDLLPHPPGK